MTRAIYTYPILHRVEEGYTMALGDKVRKNLHHTYFLDELISTRKQG